MRINFIAASSAALCLTGGLPALEYGNLDVIQLNNSNRGLTEIDPAVSIAVAPGSTPNFSCTGANRGDFDVRFGYDTDPANGVMITSVRENGRDNTAGGDTPPQAGTKYVTPLSDISGTGSGAYFFIPLSSAPNNYEFNMNLAAAYFPFHEGWLGGHTKNSSGTNGGVQDILTATPGIVNGTHFIDNAGGNFVINLSTLNWRGIPATSQNGVLLVTGQKNEDNYALSSDNANGSFNVTLKDNESDGTGLERDPIAFVYVPVAAAGSDLVTAVGRIQSDGSAEISGGNFTVTKLVESFPPVNTTANTTELEFDVVVTSAIGITVGQAVTGTGIPADTKVAAVNGSTITLDHAPTATATGVALTFTTAPTQGRWLLKIPNQTATTGTLIVTPCTGGPKNLDNIVSYQWDATAGGWVIESRDIVPAMGEPVLEDGATGDEDMFNFVFLTTQPSNTQPTVSITSPANGAEILTGNSVTITADAADTAPGFVTAVEFYINGQLASTDTTAPYSYTTPVYNLPTGAQVDAVAVDNDGSRTYAHPIVYTVTPPGGSGGLYFNGVNEYVGLGDPASLKLSTFTLETWFRRVGTGITTTTGAGGVIAAPLISKGRDQADQSNLDMNYFLGIREDGVLVADFEDSNLGINVPVTGKTSVPLDQWHHVAATFDGTKWMLYLDGNLEATRDAGGLVPRVDSIQQAALASALNSTGQPAGYFNGYLDEVRIWNTARTQTEIRSSVNFETASNTGLVARWNMSEGTGATITSTATGSLAGTLVNAPFWTPGQTFTNNVLPSVGITAPVNGARFLFGQPIPITVAASDPGGAVSQVRFYDNGSLLGSDTSAPFELSYTNAPLGGSHVLTAVAVDSLGATSLSEEIGVEVTLPGPVIPGYSAGIVNGGDADIDDDVAAVDPANWQIEASTLAPRAFAQGGTDVGDFAVNVGGSPVSFNSGILLASNHSIVGELAATDNSLAPYRGAGGEYLLSTIDNEDPGATDPIATEESSRFSLGYFPYANGWIGANVDETGTVISGSQNLPAGVTITRTALGTYQISGLPTVGNLLAMPVGDTSDNVVSVAISGQNWIVNVVDNSQNREDAPFGFVFVPTTATQVFSGQVAEAGTLQILNDELKFVGATVNRGTQGYEITIGDGNIINPSNSSLFIVADTNVGPAGDNVMSYSAVGNSFVVFSQDLPGLSGQFQAGGFRFLVVPHNPVVIHGDEVVVLATDKQATENSPDHIEFTFTRSGSTASALTVSYAVSGTATAGSDYATLPGTVTFPIGVSSVVVPVSANGDATLEPAETVNVTITPGSGYTVGVYNAAIGTILNGSVVIPKFTTSFQQGINGYTGQWDRRVGENGTAQNGSAVQQYAVDGNPGPADASEDTNGLIRFSNIFGTGPGQIPPGAEVIDAKLILTTATVSNAQSPGPWAIDRLMVAVNDSTTYASLGGDPNPNTFDGLEGARGASYGLPVAGYTGMAQGQVGTADVTQIVKAWAEGEPNYGFSIFSSPTTDGWNYDTVGNTNPLLRPKLEVTYTTLPVKDYYFLADRSAIVNSQSPTQDGSLVDTVFLDLNDPTTGTTEMLLKFPVEFGTEGGETIPIGEEIVKAELILATHSPFYGGSSNAQSPGPYAVHQMITDWQVETPPATRYGNLGPVVGTHIAPAAVRFGSMGQNTTNYIDVTSVVANWRTGDDNFGFDVKPETTDGWQPFLPGVIDHPLLSSGAPMLRIQTAIYSPGSFDNWASANGIPGSNVDEDQDHDGISAVVEYALGLNPRAFNVLPQLGVNGVISFHKGAEAAVDPGVTYKLQISTDLKNWSTLTPTVNDASDIKGQLPNSSTKVFGRLTVDYTK
ncbi:Ig-like domain-containing protein [Luteolibacter soli]|uniref:Ig-like domain-containing protein n=1 Tax=Luteolibacter soli TaxID=3135280 RepID=A0ABU9B0F8_9BACT